MDNPSRSPRHTSILKALSSIKLTLLCIVLAMFLVLLGTLAQVDLGTFIAQKKYFNSFWIYATTSSGLHLPIFPGGLTIGALWVMNLTATLIYRFNHFSRNKGLLLSHCGIILLLMGQGLTQTFARESQLPIHIGQTLNYTESAQDMELAVVQTADPQWDQVVSIPASVFSRGGEIKTPFLPFTIAVRHFFPNAALRIASEASPQPIATQGIGSRISIEELPITYADDEANNVSALVEIFEGPKSLGTWLLSSGLGAPETIHVNGKDYTLHIRSKRHYLPFSLTLKEFRHDIYPGTDIPKNFASLVRLQHPEKNEERDTLIYMNHPLRYAGRTFYQASFGKNDTLSVLQVVENPVWITPYLSCLMVLLGLGVHFMKSLSTASAKRE